MRRGLVGGAAGALAAVAGAVLVADARVGSARHTGAAGLDRFAPPPADRAGTVRTDDGLALWVEQNGPLDAPVTVVLVHGFCLDRDDLVLQRRALVEHFGDRVRVVAFDQRGHGRSGRGTTDRATIDQLGIDLACLLDAVAPDGPVVLVGHSMGGMAVMALADRHPERFGSRIAGVALFSTATGTLGAVTLGLPAGLAKVGGPAVPVLLRGARQRSRWVERGRASVTDLAWVFVRRLSFGPHVDPALVEFVTRMIGATPVEVIADFFPALMAHEKLHALPALAELPVLVVCGEDDVVTPPERSHEIAEALPKAEFVLVPAAGHQAHLERPDLVDPPLLRLVETVLCATKEDRR